jgi:hypothetical protein
MMIIDYLSNILVLVCDGLAGNDHMIRIRKTHSTARTPYSFKLYSR